MAPVTWPRRFAVPKAMAQMSEAQRWVEDSDTMPPGGGIMLLYEHEAEAVDGALAYAISSVEFERDNPIEGDARRSKQTYTD